MLAQEGYLVASVDNRGTGGRGAKFMKMTYLHLGRDESADQIAAARWVGQQPFVSADRIGIWGWSYGGGNADPPPGFWGRGGSGAAPPRPRPHCRRFSPT